MKTERLIELLKDFEKGINQAPGKGLDKVLEYQDIIGNSTSTEILAFYQDLDQPGRKHFLWSCFCCLSEDMASDIMVNTVIRIRMIKEYDALDMEYGELSKKEHALNTREEDLLSEIAKLAMDQERDRNTIKTRDLEIDRLRDQLRATNEKVDRFNSLVAKFA